MANHSSLNISNITNIDDPSYETIDAVSPIYPTGIDKIKAYDCGNIIRRYIEGDHRILGPVIFNIYNSFSDAKAYVC